jgi:hypothetical protein
MKSKKERLTGLMLDDCNLRAFGELACSVTETILGQKINNEARDHKETR